MNSKYSTSPINTYQIRLLETSFYAAADLLDNAAFSSVAFLVKGPVTAKNIIAQVQKAQIETGILYDKTGHSVARGEELELKEGPVTEVVARLQEGGYEYLLQVAAHRSEDGTQVHLVLAEKGIQKTGAAFLSRILTLLDTEYGIVVEAEEVADDSEVDVTFCYQNSQGRVSTTIKRVAVDSWEEIESNYSTKVRSELAKLFSLPRELSKGVIVLHGPAGTGKTKVLTSIAKAWEDDFEPIFLLDANNFFKNPEYMMQSLQHALLEVDADTRGVLLVIEDAGEYIFGEKAESELSMLLNLTDGVLGSAGKVRILLTTNHKLEVISKPLVRKGRCLANIYVGNLPAEEANIWLEQKNIPHRVTEETSLGDLYSLYIEDYMVK